ncbi:MAG: ribosomal protein S18-alanine N-acetyltransferase [Gammaproteobacteria bacterium]|nr:ribosomal protein S18-alanine N-acetyltransferase [Gammaproteobacteria bacterium]
MSAVMQSSMSCIRAMTAQDLSTVMEIETAAYVHSWSEGNFRDCLSAGYELVICDLEQQTIGYGVMSMAAGEAHLLNLCIHPQKQGRGYGRRLLNHLMQIADQKNVSTVYLEVRASNTRACTLYHMAGFNEIGFRTGYYPSGSVREDAVVFARSMLNSNS